MCRTTAVGSAAIVLLILCFLTWESVPALASVGIWRFFSDESWHPLSGQFNILPMMVATLITSLGAVLLAAPLGIASALFAEFYAPGWLAAIQRRLIELFAGIPSVVFGLWGLVVLAPVMANLGGSGQNLLTATIVLSLMVLPTINLLTSAAIASAPQEWAHAGSALGMQRSSIILKIVLPGVRRGIGVAILLAVTRALGETMAVLMLAGNVVKMPTSLLSPGRTLNANVALELGYASGAHRSVLFVTGLISLLLVSAIVLAISRRGASHDAKLH